MITYLFYFIQKSNIKFKRHSVYTCLTINIKVSNTNTKQELVELKDHSG